MIFLVCSKLQCPSKTLKLSWKCGVAFVEEGTGFHTGFSVWGGEMCVESLV